MNNMRYKLSADVQRRDISFEECDFVMTCIGPDLNTPTKKLHARAIDPYQIMRKLGSNAYVRKLGSNAYVRKLESNAYVLDLPDNLGISPIFNVEDLTLHRGAFEPLSLRFGTSAGTQVSKLPTSP